MLISLIGWIIGCSSWICIYGERPTSDICVPTNDVAIYHRYTISGIQANSSHKGIVIINGKKYFVK